MCLSIQVEPISIAPGVLPLALPAPKYLCGSACLEITHAAGTF